jgi:hypothetical protein
LEDLFQYRPDIADELGLVASLAQLPRRMDRNAKSLLNHRDTALRCAVQSFALFSTISGAPLLISVY